MARKEIKGIDFVKFVENEEVTGKYTREDTGINDSKIFVLEVDGQEKAVGGSVLETKFKHIKIGQTVYITYLGEKKSTTTRNDYKDYKVEVEE